MSKQTDAVTIEKLERFVSILKSKAGVNTTEQPENLTGAGKHYNQALDDLMNLIKEK